MMPKTQTEEARAERIIQSNPSYGSAFWTMSLTDLQAAIDEPRTHPSLRRKAITILATRLGA